MMNYYQPAMGTGLSSLFSLFFCLFFIGIFVVGFIFLFIMLARSGGHHSTENMTDEEKTAHDVNDALIHSSEDLYNKMQTEEKLSPKQIIQFARDGINKRLDEIEKPHSEKTSEAKHTNKEQA